jgi:NADP-dependent 3-hydroxy acid dehydrogenase YdfG
MSDSPVTLVTGGSAGIGAATARRLLELGHRVTVTGRDEQRLAQFTKEAGHPDTLLAVAGDAADHAAVQAAVDATVERFGRLDNAVANAGFATDGTVIEGDPAGCRDMVLTNVLGPALLVRVATEQLRATRGRIVLVGSVAGFIPTVGNLYAATKWAVTGLAESTRRAVTGDGIGVTLIAPGRVETPFWEGRSSVPEGPMLTAEQIAESIAWAVGQPEGVDVNTVVVRPVGQPN